MEVDGEAQYEVECLLMHRAQRVGTRYLVSWTGYGSEHDQWIHEDNLGHAWALLDKYKHAHGLQ